MVLISLLAIFIVAGILLYPDPGRAADTRNTDVRYIKIIILPSIDPSIQFGEPGEDPTLSTGFLGSSTAIGADEQQTDLPKDAGTEAGILKPRFVKKLFYYLNTFSSSSIQGR